MPWVIALVSACARPGAGEAAGEITVLLDGNVEREGLEVLAAPVDPRRPLAGVTADPPRALPPQTADSVGRLERERDSASALALTFVREREALDHEAALLDALDPRSRGYAVRFDAFRRRKAAAESTRTLRNRVRGVARRLAAQLGDPGRLAAGGRPVALSRDGVERLSDGPRRAVVQPITGRRTVLRLAYGPWWIGVARTHDAVPAAFIPVRIGGARDSVHVGVPGQPRATATPAERGKAEIPGASRSPPLACRGRSPKGSTS